jgi:plasmid stability protein
MFLHTKLQVIENKRKKVDMAPTTQAHFRLRKSTMDKLRLALDASAHRSMAALADDILDKALDKMLEEKPEFDAAGALRGIKRDG